jgi:hypothetical protein
VFPKLSENAIASKAVRLSRLERMCVAAMDAGSYREAADLLEQAAKEVGGMFSAKGMEPVQQGPVEPRSLGPERLAEIAARFGRGLKLIEGESGE